MMRTTTKIGFVALSSAMIGYSILQAGQAQKDRPDETRLIHSIQGPALYSAYCAVCHGKDGKGNGPMAQSLKVAPSDLTKIRARNKGTFPGQRLARLISGDEQLQSHGTREMPIWGPIFSQIAWDQDLGRIRIDNLVRYIERLQSK